MYIMYNYLLRLVCKSIFVARSVGKNAWSLCVFGLLQIIVNWKKEF